MAELRGFGRRGKVAGEDVLVDTRAVAYRGFVLVASRRRLWVGVELEVVPAP